MTISLLPANSFSVFVAHARSLFLCAFFLFLHTHTHAHSKEGIPFVEVVVCWCGGDVERGGGALAGSGLCVTYLGISPVV